jgi:ubiquinone/menaquinone biosynthesis C-methylase UbiE
VSSGELNCGRGLHVAESAEVDAASYDGYVGRWSRLFVLQLLTAARIKDGFRILDLATGPGEAAQKALSMVAGKGFVVGADISQAMLASARTRISDSRFGTVAADGHALPLKAHVFDTVVCRLGLQFFSDPAHALVEVRRVLRASGYAAVCVIGPASQAPMWGVLADVPSDRLPAQRELLHFSFSQADVPNLIALFDNAGFDDVAVIRETRHGVVESFEHYWSDIEAGVGMLPQGLPRAFKGGPPVGPRRSAGTIVTL